MCEQSLKQLSLVGACTGYVGYVSARRLTNQILPPKFRGSRIILYYIHQTPLLSVGAGNETSKHVAIFYQLTNYDNSCYYNWFAGTIGSPVKTLQTRTQVHY